jgi:hypothetical protein
MKSRLATFIFFLIAVAAFFISAPLWATDCRGNSCNGGGDIDIGGTNVDVGTDVTVGDTNVNVPITTGPTNVTGGDTTLNNESRAIALSNVLGDVDIAGCLGSTQWATPLFSKQKLVVNWPCLTEFYLRNGKYELAAMAICNTEIVKEFASEADCEAAHDFEEIIEEAVIVYAESDDEEVEYLREELQRQEAFHDELEGKVQSLEQQQRIVIREPYLSDEKKDKLREIVGD